MRDWRFPGLLLLACITAGCERAEQEPASGSPEHVAAEPARAAEPDPARTETEEQLRTALEQLTRGEHEAALADGQSWFSEETTEVLRSVDVDSSGHATVDFVDLRPIIGNASSSAGSQILLHDLNSVVFGIADIQSVEYRMLGSCDLFGEWLQYGCLRVTRAEHNGGS